MCVIYLRCDWLDGAHHGMLFITHPGAMTARLRGPSDCEWFIPGTVNPDE